MATVANNQLTFQSVQFKPVIRHSKIYLTAVEIAAALGHKRANAVTQIYERNKDEFTGDMTESLKLRLSGNYQKSVRIFSLRGAHLIAMFAKTETAKAFRKWVLDILDKEVASKSDEVVGGPTSTLDRTPLKDAVNMLVAKRGLNYPDAYRMVHHRFDIQSLDELTKDQLPAAIEYVHRLCIEGEVMPKLPAEPAPASAGLTVTLPHGNYSRWLVIVEDGKTSLIDASNKAMVDLQVARQLSNEAGAVAAYIESKAEQRDLEAKLLREESRRLRIFMGEESQSRLDTPISAIFPA